MPETRAELRAKADAIKPDIEKVCSEHGVRLKINFDRWSFSSGHVGIDWHPCKNNFSIVGPMSPELRRLIRKLKNTQALWIFPVIKELAKGAPKPKSQPIEEERPVATERGSLHFEGFERYAGEGQGNKP